MKSYVKPTKPYLKDLKSKTQFQFNILNKYNKRTYTSYKDVLLINGPITNDDIEAYIDKEFVNLLQTNADAVKDVRAIRDYLESISGDR